MKSFTQYLVESSTLSKFGIDKKAISRFHKYFGIAHDAKVEVLKTKSQASNAISKGNLVIFKSKTGNFGAIGNSSTWKSKRYPGIFVDANGETKTDLNFKKSDYMSKIPAGSEFWMIKDYQANYISPKAPKDKWDKSVENFAKSLEKIPKFVKSTVSNALKARGQQQLKSARTALIKAIDSASIEDLNAASRGSGFSGDRKLTKPLADMADAKSLISAGSGDLDLISDDLNVALKDVYGKVDINGVRDYGTTSLDVFFGKIATLSTDDPRWDRKKVDSIENVIRKVIVQYIKNMTKNQK
jgi:hypothetical protein